MDLKGHDGTVPVHFASFEPDRRRDVSVKHPNWPRLLTASGGELIVWNTENSQPLARAVLHAQIGKAAWSPDGKWIAAAGWNRLVILDAETGKELAVNETGRGHMDGTINLAANGKTLRLHHSQGLRAFNADTGEQTQNLTDFPQGASLASPNDQWLAIYNSSLDRDQLWIVDSETGQQRSSLVGHTRGVTAVNWSPDGKQLATASLDQTVRVWNVSDGQQAQLLQHDRAVRAVIWSPDGQQLATCADDDQVRIWTLAKKNQTPRVFDRVPSPVATGPYSMSWSPDGKLIAMADAGASARVLDIKSGKLSDPFIQFVAGMQCVAWSPDGKQILAANGWEVGYRAVAAKESAVVGGLGAPIFWHPDKRRFITGCWGNYPIQAFDTRKSTKLGTLIPRFGPGAAHWVCIGPDGHFRGSENVESQLVMVAITKDGSQKLYSIADFSEKYGWKNDPAKVRLLKLDDVVTK